MIFSNINIDTRMFSTEHWWGKAEPIAITAVRRREDTEIGYIRNVRFQNINACGENGVLIYGEETKNISNIAFENIHIRLTKKTEWPKQYHDLRPNAGNTILEDSLRVVYARNARDISFTGFSCEIDANIAGEIEEAVSIENCCNVSL